MNAPQPLRIDRSTPFSPSTFIGEGWDIWRGPTGGAGLDGHPDQDGHALTLTDLDLSRVDFIHTLKDGERWVRGEENLLRLKAREDIVPLDAAVVQALYEEPGQTTLEWLRTERGITWFVCPGTVLRDAEGFRHVLGPYWADGRWTWYPHWLENNLRKNRPSAVLARENVVQ